MCCSIRQRDQRAKKAYFSMAYILAFKSVVIDIFHLQALQTCECVPLLLSVFEVCTMSRSSIDIAKQLLPEVYITKKRKTLCLNVCILPLVNQKN